jgi:FlaA1/EpsC-like NDP-sugar epimerase
MTIEQAVELILKCAEETKGDEIYVLKMPAINICDLASSMIDYFRETTKSVKKIEVQTVGIRPGEKIFEELISCDEMGKLEDRGDYFIIYRNPLGKCEKIGFSYASNQAALIPKSEIMKILYDNKI